MSYLIRDKQVKAYNEVKDYSNDDVYRKTLDKAYGCLKKSLATSVIFLMIGVVVSTSISWHAYMYYFNGSDRIVGMLLSILITAIITVIIALLGVVVSRGYMNLNELEYLNSEFKNHSFHNYNDNSRFTVNSDGVYFTMGNGEPAKISNQTKEGIKVVLSEYYEMNNVCVINKIKEYSVYNTNGSLINRVMEKQLI